MQRGKEFKVWQSEQRERSARLTEGIYCISMVAANNSEREEGAEAEAVTPVAALSMASVVSGAESPSNAASSQDTLDGRRASDLWPPWKS